MAQFFPARTNYHLATRGEPRRAGRLENKLEDDYLCWFNIPVMPKALQPDVVLMHPLRGAVLKVEDWKLEAIQSMDRDLAKIYADGLLKTRKSSIRARAFAIEMLTARDAAENGVPIVAPQSAGRRGAFPELLRYECDWREYNCIVECIRDKQGKDSQSGRHAEKCEDEADEAHLLAVCGHDPHTRSAGNDLLRNFQLYLQNSGLNLQCAPAPGRDGLTEGSRLI